MEILVSAVCASIAAAVGILIFIGVAKQFLFIGRPNELLVFSGRKRKLANGTEIGYREVLGGGRAWRIPILEKVESMELTTIPIDIHVSNAYSKGGIPLDVHAVANIKVSSESQHVGNAIERFLGRDPREIQRVGKETLEGHLRGVLARLTPEQVNEDRLTFAETVKLDVDEDFDMLGLALDTLKIQNVADSANYLESIGRQRIAEVIRDAEIAESTAMAEARQEEAIAKQKADVASEKAQGEIISMENKLRELKAELDAKIQSEEAKALAASQQARASAEAQLQEVRRDVEILRLQADHVLPAEAEKKAEELRAKGDAATIEENGKAMALVLQMLTDAWLRAGNDAKDIFLIQQLEEVLQTVITRIKGMEVGEVTLIDGGDGNALPRHIASFPKAVRQVMEELHASTGVDITGILAKTNINTDKN
ncbi:MAG: SPFH domain-containing protein [Myxococcota bacterium]|nr:SPFH domain-containing protein [Myxococcota bacterium]